MDYYSPFSLSLVPMERLLLINITKDPDEVYTGFEPQAYDDPATGRGLIVIAYLHDGRIDVYHQPGVNLSGKNFDIVGQGLREQAERPMAGARFDISPTGLDLDIAFDDLLGRPIRLRIREERDKPTHPFAILAPMGNSAEHPPALPLYFLYDFYFVRRARTELRISVGGRDHKPDSIPMLLDGARVHFLRYAAAPFIVDWNAAHDGELAPLSFADGDRRAIDGPVTHELALIDGRPALAAMAISDGRRALRVAFHPPFPDVTALPDGAGVAGTFAVEAGAGGAVTGTYHTGRAGDQVDITLQPSGGWRPGPVQWGARLIFALVPLFRKWPQTYVWRGRVDLSGERPRLRSRWERSAAAGQGAIRLFGQE